MLYSLPRTWDCCTRCFHTQVKISCFKNFSSSPSSQAATLLKLGLKAWLCLLILLLPGKHTKQKKNPKNIKESWYVKNDVKTEHRSVEKAAVVPLLRKADKSKGGQNEMKRPKTREKMQLEQWKERLEMLVVSNKEQLCFVDAAFYSSPAPAHPLGPGHLFYGSGHNVVLRRKTIL